MYDATSCCQIDSLLWFVLNCVLVSALQDMVIHNDAQAVEPEYRAFIHGSNGPAGAQPPTIPEESSADVIETLAKFAGTHRLCDQAVLSLLC